MREPAPDQADPVQPDPDGPAGLDLPGPRARDARGAEVVAAWATGSLPLAVSGRLAVVTAVRGDALAIVTTMGSLLARGYLSSMALLFDSATHHRAPRMFEEAVVALGSRPGDWLADWHLQPISPALASRLVWGLYTASLALGTVDRASIPVPALDLVPAPPGLPAQWRDDFFGRFGPGQLDVARELARRPDRWEGAPAERPDVPAAVSFQARVARPQALRAVLERLPEFQPYLRPDEYMWLRREPGAFLAQLEHHRIAGTVHVSATGTLAVNVDSAAAAAALAARLDELTWGGLALDTCTWYPPEHTAIPSMPGPSWPSDLGAGTPGA